MVVRQSYFYFNMDQPLDLVVREKPVDSVTAARIERTRQPFPSSQDFAEGGRFAHLKIPYFPPVPMEILRYLYGDDVTYEMVSPRDQANLLRCLHKLINPNNLYCDCGAHILKKLPDINEGPHHGFVM